MSRKLKRYILSIAAVPAVAIIGAVGFWRLPAFALHDANWVNSHVEWDSPAAGSAKSAVAGWENACSQDFQQNKNSMPHSTEAQQREVVNASAYYQSVWLTRQGDPRNINNSPVTAGAPVNMQVNDLLFLCAIITMNPSGFQIDPTHRVTNGNYPNDRAPVPDSGAAQYKVNQASRYESNSRIYNVSVISGPGSISNKPIGQILGYNRDNNSRYWNAPAIPFTYNSPNNLPSGTYRVTIEFEYATIQTYHDYGSSGTSRCRLKTTGDGANVPYNRFDLCEHRTEAYTFTFRINSPFPPSSVFPSSTVDKPKISYPDTATFRHYVNVTGYSIVPGSVNYSIQRYRNGAPVGSPAAGTFNVTGNGQQLVGGARAFDATAADAGDTICERLQLSSPSSSVTIATNRPNPSEVCTVVVARPYLTVTNNDVWAGGRFDLAHDKCVGAAPRTSSISSWVSSNTGAVGEYGVMALGAITEFGSGNQPSNNGLTFANTPTNGTLGAPTRCIGDYYSSIGTGGATPLPGILSLSFLPGSGKQKYFVNGNATFFGGTLAANKQAVILVNGDVTIKNDLLYADNYTSQGTISSLWIVARGNIYIEEGVRNLNGLFVTQGKIHTCVRTNTKAPPNPLTASTCTNGLDVFGGFIADQIFWQRTRGTAAPGQPYAESVQFDSGLYLNSPLNTVGSDTHVQDTKELPPIY